MWNILKAEITYNKYIFLVYFCFIPLICIFEIFLPDAPNFYILIPMFFIIQNWIISRNKAMRDFQLTKLPLSIRQVAMARISMVILSSLCVIGLYVIIHLILNSKGPANYPVTSRALIIFFGIITFGFSIYFIFRDLFLFFLRNNNIFKLTKERSIRILLLFGLLFYLLGIYALVKRPAVIGNIFYFVKHNNPFTSDYVFTLFIISSFLLAYLTVITFSRRKSYLE